ncbi:HK97 family phage portal protein [Lysinibacillus composti]|uniref:Phage portal protein n=1 Tax=Lysinibacillus composti TaxID=720633 RepID=A0A3N9UIP4_9BACI|nr:phage portal protein [Lysinibacillus composti]MBM7607566.1 HK97 family phage portal protein [Lysinibacillus composti]RQW75929.1 phage portal protein [Lysinibacillus composti]
MGLFEKMFGKKTSPSTTHFELINDSGGGFYSWEGKLYKSDVIRAAIRPKATAIGKLVAKHVRDNAEEFKINPNVQIKFLLEEPNLLMSGQVMQEKLAVQLELNNNAFAYIKRDDFGFANEIYPLPASSVEVVEGAFGDVFLKFNFNNGKSMTIPYVDVIHLRKDFNNHDFFGEHPGEALMNLMEVVNTTDQGIVKAIKNSAIIKWILKFTSVLKPTDMRKAVDEFTENYLSINSTVGGAAAADGRYDLQQVKNEAFVPDDKQLTNTIQRVYSFFNTNEKIVQSRYTEDEWNAYYEAQIEPVAMQLANEFTRKLFTRRERGFGNKIIFEAASLQYASMSTKMNLVQMVDRGALTPNEWRSILSLGPIENGDKPIRRLDTAEVNKGKVVEGGEKDDNENGNTKSDNE